MRRYLILDVFTATPLEGNSLAVVLDGESLSDAAMQSIAAEFNLSETVFVLPPDNPVHTAKLRIFTPKSELPFAGHPTVGTAVALAVERGHAMDADALLILEEKIGAVRCFVQRRDGGGHARFDAPRLPSPLAVADHEVIASALGLLPVDLGFENHIPSGYDSGVPHVFVPVRNLETIARVAPQTAVWRAAFGTSPAYVYTRETASVARQFHARMFAPHLGIAEDPATGSAAVGFAGVIHRFDAHPDGSHAFIIEQGFEMGRPSLLHLEVDVEGAVIARIRLGGDTIIVAEGTLNL
ncbi:MAG: PhzF family phenazine biosynthesis protein [Bauldia sp.]